MYVYTSSLKATTVMQHSSPFNPFPKSPVHAVQESSASHKWKKEIRKKKTSRELAFGINIALKAKETSRDEEKYYSGQLLKSFSAITNRKNCQIKNKCQQ